MSTCYTTLYFDIGRKDWNSFSRTFEQYLENFKPFIPLFDKKTCEEDEMIAFIDERYFDILNNLVNKDETNIKIISINESFLETLYMWKTLDIEQSIMDNEYFKQSLGSRRGYPEHNFAKYTLINHCKIDLIAKAIELGLSKNDYYAWVDFGLFKLEENIPSRLLDIEHFDKNKINYTLINPINSALDSDIDLNLKIAPEKIGGFFFIGRKDVILRYQTLYHKGLDVFQKILCIADDDQHLVLQLYFMYPDIFSLRECAGEWHSVFKYFQKLTC